MRHSNWAKHNMTKQLKSQLGFYYRDLQHERASLKKARSYVKWNLPGVKSMILQHQRGVKKTLRDIRNMKIRIRKRQRNNECYKII